MFKLAPFIVLLLPATLNASPDTLPSGWRLPTQTEIDAVPIRNRNESKYLRISGDFNSDGKQDFAQLVKSEDLSGEGFAVRLSTTSGYEWRIVDHFKYKTPPTTPTLYMGLSIANPGEYKTACGKGYWECKEGEPEILHLEHIGIVYFYFESASSIWYWDKPKGEFRQIWISD